MDDCCTRNVSILDDQLGHALSNALSKTILHVCSNLRVVVLQRPLFVFLGIVHIAPFLLHPRIFNGERACLRMAGISALLNLLL